MSSSAEFDLLFADLGPLSVRDYDLLRIGVLTTILRVASEEEMFNQPLHLPAIFRSVLSNELDFRRARVIGGEREEE